SVGRGNVAGRWRMRAGGTALTVVLDPGPPGKDDLFLKLTPGKGAFTAGVAPGTFTIGGADANFLSCGLCTNLIADITTMGPSKFYFALSGTVTVSMTTPQDGGPHTN